MHRRLRSLERGEERNGAGGIIDLFALFMPFSADIPSHQGRHRKWRGRFGSFPTEISPKMYAEGDEYTCQNIENRHYCNPT
jgi:hypothetical protein